MGLIILTLLGLKYLPGWVKLVWLFQLLLFIEKQVITNAEKYLHKKAFFRIEQIFGEKSGATLGQKVGQLFSIDK